MVIFVHVPGFYAAVEQADQLTAGSGPLIVGGNPSKRGTVTSANAEALASGVSLGMEVKEALRRCPDAEFRPTRLRRYREVAAELRSVLRSFTDRIEPVGLDGAYLEVRDSEDPVAHAAEICVRLQAELGLAAVAGIGPTRFVAHMAARHPGSGGIHTVRPEQAKRFLAQLPVTEIWGLGPATAKKLAAWGVETIGGLRGMPVEELQELAGRHAATFLALANGEDRDPIRPQPRAKSLSQEKTLARPSLDLGTLGDDLFELAAGLQLILRRERRAARTLTLGVSYTDGEEVTRTQTLRDPVATQHELGEIAVRLLSRTQAGVRSIRRLRLQVSNLCHPEGDADPRQLRLL